MEMLIEFTGGQKLMLILVILLFPQINGCRWRREFGAFSFFGFSCLPGNLCRILCTEFLQTTQPAGGGYPPGTENAI